jgi:hypothetical protein
MESIQVDPLTEFFEAIRSPLTKDRYEHRLDLFLKHIGIPGENLRERALDFAAKARKDGTWAAYKINEYMRYQKGRAEKGEIAESTLANFWKPIKLFTEQNDILLNWRKITRRIPAGRNYASDRTPTPEEIRAILRYDDPRIKPVVLMMVSGGFRVGAWDYFKWEDVKPIEKSGVVVAASIKVYSGMRAEYTSFITPEAYRALRSWMDSRTLAGESVTGKSWIMRDLWEEKASKRGGVQQRGIARVPKKLTSTGVTRLIQRALFAQGIRTKLERGKKRHEFQANHGFRKFFNTACDRQMKTLYVEFLMGHDTGLKESYNRAKEEELLTDYLKAVPELTLLEASTLSAAVESVEALKERIALLEENNRKNEEAKQKQLESTAIQTRLILLMMQGKIVPDQKEGAKIDYSKIPQEDAEAIKSFMGKYGVPASA